MKQTYTFMIMNKIHILRLGRENQEITKLLSNPQLDCSTTYQKTANFHLLQKPICNFSCYVMGSLDLGMSGL